ncbi:Orf y [Tanacetum coccineum]
MPMHKGIPNKNTSSSGAINILNLDCISDLIERKRILEKWSAEISLILQTNQDDFQTAKSVLTLIEHKTEGNIQSLVKQAQWNEDLHGIDFFDSVIDILYTMFVGIDYHGNKDLEIIKEQEQARRNLTRVQLVNICSLDEYTCVYEKNIYKIPLSEHLQWIEAYLMKIPIISEQTIQRWKNEGNVISRNSLAFATRLAKEEITKICDTRYKQKKLKSLSRSCCENIVNMENLDIGRIRNEKKKSFYKKKYKKKYKTSWKQKRKRFSPGKYFKPTKDPPEKYCPKDVLEDKKQLQRFLGVLTYAETYIEKLAKMRQPLQGKLKKDIVWNWTQSDTDYIKKIKKNLTVFPKLYLPSNEDFLIIETDASEEIWGGILKAKTPDNNEKICRYTSGSFKAAEKNYHSNEKELLAVKNVISKFSAYLTPVTFLVRTDNKNFTYFLRTNIAGDSKQGRLVRWQAWFSHYSPN